MNLRQRKSLFPVAALAVFALAVAHGQTQDGSGNGLLKGNFRFRHIAVQAVDLPGNPTQITASYGLIMFDGLGNYTVTGTSVDNTVSGGAPQALNVTGTYAIGSNGTGYVANPLFTTDFNDYIYGAVSQGVFSGSSTEAEGEGYVLNDVFIAIPTAATAPTNASFTAAYQTGLLDFAAGGSTAVKNALFKLSPNGQGAFGAISLSGQASNQTAASLTQSITGATYSFNSDGSATLTAPLPSGVTSTNALFNGAKTMFESADGNFILGWTATGYDIFFGVKALAIAGTNSISKGLYFTTGLEDSPGASGAGADSFYGSISNSGDSAGDGIAHARLNFPGYSAYDFGTDDQIVLNADGTAASPDFSGYQIVFGDAGLAFVGIGTNGNFALFVGLHAASFSGTGVYLNPIGVVNAASFQPITASLAPGELITLFGTGLSPVTLVTSGGIKFPTTLGGVSVTIDNIPCPIYYVTPGQLAVIVPYALASNQTGLADIQVTNGTKSNVVQMYFSDSAPGAFSQTQNGLGIAAALHALTGALITATNRAQPGEYISLFVTGLGTVTPAVNDGSLGPTSPLSVVDLNTSGSLTVYFNDYGPKGTTGNVGSIQFAGLAPGLAGLYQINVQVPTKGLASGDNVYVEFATDLADVNQIQIPYGTAASGGTASRPARTFGEAARARAKRRKASTCTAVARTGVRSACIQ
jgi:uncharacterized protein (TIGR03437 family)